MQDALSWWNANVRTLGATTAYQISWTEFKTKMLKKYCPRSELKRLEEEFHALIVRGIDLRAYNRRFQELKVLCPSIVPDLEKTLEKYVEGLPRSIEGNVTASNPASLESAMEIAQRLLDREVKYNELKRKLDDKRTTHHNNNYHGNTSNHRNNNNQHHNNRNNQQRRQEPNKAFAATEAKGYQGLKP